MGTCRCRRVFAGCAAAWLCVGGCGGAGEGGAATSEDGSEAETCVLMHDFADEDIDEDALEFVSLIDHGVWTQLDGVADPLAAHRPETVTCGLGGWYTENGDLEVEVDTNSCNYLALRQPSLLAIEAGKVLRVGFYHFDLVAPDPAQGHLRVSVDGEVVWDYVVDIVDDPELNGARAPASFQTHTVFADFCAPAGAEVVLHVHNHGQNTWALRELEISR